MSSDPLPRGEYAEIRTQIRNGFLAEYRKEYKPHMNFIKSVVNAGKSFLRKAKNFVKSIPEKIEAAVVRTQTVLADSTAENYVGEGVKVLIAVVIGALLLAGLYTLFNSTIMPTVTSKIQSLFNYNGT